MLTDEEYVAIRGGVCPFCKSSDIEGGNVEIDASGASQQVRCLDCEKEWTDYYKLIGFEPVV